MGHQIARFSEGKTTYWVRYQRFFNDAYARDGKERAEKWCLENNVPLEEIIVFDSQLEADRYEYLVELQKQGKITKLTHHLKLPILPEFTNYIGDTIPALTLNSDFTYVDENGHNVVEDVKGASLFQDSRFEAVKQIFDYIYKDKCYLRIIIKREGKWIEWHLGERKKARTLLQKQREKIHALQKEQHDREIADNLKARELQRLKELREIKSQGIKLSSPQKKRLAELELKYGTDSN